MLTEAGRRWAEENAAESMVAAVALTGAENGWPDSHVAAAVGVANREAEHASGAHASRTVTGCGRCQEALGRGEG